MQDETRNMQVGDLVRLILEILGYCILCKVIVRDYILIIVRQMFIPFVSIKAS